MASCRIVAENVLTNALSPGFAGIYEEPALWSTGPTGEAVPSYLQRLSPSSGPCDRTSGAQPICSRYCQTIELFSGQDLHRRDPQRSLINQRRHPWPGPAHRASHRAPWTLGWLNALLTPPAISPEIPVPTVLLRGRRLLKLPDPRQRPGSRRESRQDPAVNYPGLFCVVFWKKGSSPSAAGPVPVFGRRVDFPRDW